VRLIIHLVRERRQYDILYLAPMSRMAAAAAVVARSLGKRVVGRVVLPSASETGTRAGAFRSINTILRRRFDAVVAQTPDVARLLVDGGMPAGRVTTIPNPVDTRRFSPLALDERRAVRRALWPDWPGDALVVLTASRLVAGKDTATLLRAVAGARGWRVVVAGDGPERPALERLAASIGLGDRVIFAGRVSDMAPLYQASDLFALLSKHEVLSNALLEALSTALPAIVTRVGGLADVGAELGLPLLTPGDVESVRSVLDDLGRSPDRRAALGAAGRRLAETRFAAAIVIPQYVGVLAGLARAGPV
jgi:glycosyltransferase involved in cell wall biosynthesis